MTFDIGAAVQWILQHKLLLSICLIILLLSCRQWLIGLIRKRAKRKAQDKRHLVNTVKNAANLSLFVLLLGIWSSELQNLALSIAAFTVAIVLATREFIQCITGFIYATSTRIFRVGDWIQVGNHSGEVIESDWFKLTLLEVDLHNYEYSGKTLTLPNNLLITNPVKNLNFLKRYSTHTFVLVRDQSVNPFTFKDELLQRAAAHCEHFKDVAVRYSNLIQKRLEVPISGPEPDIRLTTNHLGDTEARITIFCPTEQAIEIEQKITQDYMALWFEHKLRNQQLVKS
ncbi:mechanosensitive ion channel family protein [Aliiglaciecola sp. CAU 1673]|uniref:mechanosensitive ion channel family protein n=1 Tax=Aliiglaciecola sp. CAU 1673 TaxID=3032595 RepID=UPI0023D982A5|nr:mechanosensitive ion channel family protein [Aliiglaciecola sp. CAU 1673]MDF2180388.1 mechanosensitive ion channel family protein [Aliiglaciecola sp. CAU 1673]